MMDCLARPPHCAWTLLALLIVASGVACAATAPLPKGTPVLGDDPLGAFKLGGQAARADAESRTVAVEGQPFDKALRLTTRKLPARIYHIQVAAPTTAPVKRGDVLLATFAVRAAAGEQAFTQCIFERRSEPWTKSATLNVVATPTWQRYHMPFVSQESYPAGGAQLLFRLGYKPQTIEIGGVALTNFASDVPIGKLPNSGHVYTGAEPDAPWRKAALERIEKIRKADLAIVVADAAGKPAPNARVAVRMRRHAFPFGSCVNAGALFPDNETDDVRKYRETIKTLFNRVVIENSLKWPYWEDARRRARVVKSVKWLNDNGIEVRGHCLVWPSWKHTPRDVRLLKNDKARLARRVLDHIREEATAMRGQLVDWDVINEPFSNHDIMDTLGRECMVEWFKAAREADPKVRLYINDYAILARGGNHTAHQNHYFETIRFLIDNGAPLDGIGMQAHFSGGLTPPKRLLEVLDRFATFGKTIQATEFDINISDEARQAAYLRDFMTALFSHPAVEGIIMWGFWEGRHWKPNASLFRRDWSPKPNAQAWQELVFRTWWTNADGTADAQGRFATRGFLGRYRIEAEAGGRKASADVALPRDGATVKLVLE